jgi:hypothetical protein
LIAKILGTASGGPGCQVTVGKDEKEAMDAIAAYGSTAIPLDVNEVHVDEANLVVSTPAYMIKNPQPHEVFDGIGAMIEEVMKLSERANLEEGEQMEDITVLEEIGESMFGKEKWQEMKTNGIYDQSSNPKHAKPTGYADEALADFKTIKRVQI